MEIIYTIVLALNLFVVVRTIVFIRVLTKWELMKAAALKNLPWDSQGKNELRMTAVFLGDFSNLKKWRVEGFIPTHIYIPTHRFYETYKKT